MMDIIVITLSVAVLYLIGRPIINWFAKAKKEMNEQDDRAE